MGFLVGEAVVGLLVFSLDPDCSRLDVEQALGVVDVFLEPLCISVDFYQNPIILFMSPGVKRKADSDSVTIPEVANYSTQDFILHRVVSVSVTNTGQRQPQLGDKLAHAIDCRNGSILARPLKQLA